MVGRWSFWEFSRAKVMVVSGRANMTNLTVLSYQTFRVPLRTGPLVRPLIQRVAGHELEKWSQGSQQRIVEDHKFGWVFGGIWIHKCVWQTTAPLTGFLFVDSTCWCVDPRWNHFRWRKESFWLCPVNFEHFECNKNSGLFKPLQVPWI